MAETDALSVKCRDKCESCSDKIFMCWHIDSGRWRLLPAKWWDKVLCLKCYIALVSRRQNRLVILLPEDFGPIVISSQRVRGKLNKGVWPFPVAKSARRIAAAQKTASKETKDAR